MASLWTAKSGTTLASISEGLFANIVIPVNFPYSVEVISGKLPPGLELTNSFTITGVPEEVPALTEYRFVLRARKGKKVEDRTFSIEVIGEDAPEWVTPSGLLPVGRKQTLFVIDGSLVNFQLEVTDPDTRAGQNLEYFIPSGGGELPPSLELTSDGRIVGQIKPILALETDAGRGAFDENRFDKYPYDFAILDPDSRIPRKLNQFYKFIVAVSDGDTIAEREFDIFVVGDDFLRADNTILEVGEGIFTADNTYVRSPIWLTPSNLGVQRANNNITLFLDVLDPFGASGTISYNLEGTNADGSESKLPPGTEIDESTGEVFGRLPYQAAVTNTYKFTVTAKRTVSDTTETASTTKTFTVDIIGEVDSTITWITDSNLGSVDSNYKSILRVDAVTTVPDSFLIYTLESGSLPPGLNLLSTGEIAGQIDNRQINETGNFSFTIKARDQFRLSEISKEFVLRVVKEEDIIYSDIFYSPLLPESDRNQFYNLVSNPEVFDPDSVYRPNDPNFGLQQQIKILVYSGLEISQAEQYVAATALSARKKRLKVDDVKTAEAKLPGTNEIVYEVVYLDLYDPYERNGDVETEIKIKTDDKITVDSFSFIDSDIFDSKSSLAVSTRLNPANRIYFEPNLTAETREGPVTLTDVFNIETRDSLVSSNYSVGSSTNIKILPDYRNTIKADSTGVKVSDVKVLTRYVSNISNLRNELRNIGETNRNALPLWMRTAQPGTVQELGYTLAAPLCYCKPGTSDTIKRAIEFSNLDFRQFDLEVDRILVEETESSADGTYFIFANREYNI